MKKDLDWMELSEKLDSREESNIVQETLSQIASEEAERSLRCIGVGGSPGI